MTINQLPRLSAAYGQELIAVSQNDADYSATIDDLLGMYTLVNGSSVSAGSVTLHGGRSLANYNILIAEWRVNGAIRATAIVRKDSFVGANNLSLFYVDSGNTQRYVEIAYVSNTSVTLTASGNALGDVYLFGL